MLLQRNLTMRNRISLFTGVLLACVVLFSTSCKKCKLAEGENRTGLVVEDVIIYPASGYMTQNMGGNYHIYSGHPLQSQFEVSFDGGHTRQSPNLLEYSILANPMNVECEASLNYDVTYNPVLDSYIYTVSGETCSGCETTRYVENYILVPAIPAGSSIIYEDDVTTK